MHVMKKEDAIAERGEGLFHRRAVEAGTLRSGGSFQTLDHPLFVAVGLQAAQAGYTVGKVDFLTLLNSLLTLQDSQLELHGEIVSHEKALARLEAVTGGPLDGLLQERKQGS